ncbi:Com family DNA-binding transcriptional regulator [Andreprevotia sp. IGB-42]|uniref:Com family DNA-binding transcriptional regulator n=1 Tax=Andreprevotia sp. IGB-42 TaxID=2497473 RepID=UPI0013590F47
MNEIRCVHCSKKLAEGQFTWLTIKCPRCRGTSIFRATAPTPERQRAPSPGANDGSQSNRSLAGRQTSSGR